MIIATAGHVDHGKTSLVKALTGVDTDRLPEERKRGLTIDLGFAFLPVRGAPTLGFVDVPGHERFIHNMLCGVAGIDVALLVVAADDGPMPQTREHLAILDLLGVAQGLVALTKIDRVPAERIAAVRGEIAALLEGTTLRGAPVFACSTPTGEGLDPLLEHLRTIARENPSRATRGMFRLAVDRSFTVAGAGLVVTGTVFSGQLSSGEAVRVLPAGIAARVRSIHAQSAPAAQGQVGERCALNLVGAGLGPSRVVRGDWIVAGDAAPAARKLDARLRVLAGEARALRHWTPVHLHLGATQVMARIAVLEAAAIEPGASALVQLVLDRAIGAVSGDRFIVRDQSARRTIGGGRVISAFPPSRGRARPARLAALRALEERSDTGSLESLLAVSPGGIDLRAFASDRNLTEAEAEAAFAGVSMRRAGTPAAPLGFSLERWAAMRTAALERVAGWHRDQPQSPGPAEAQLLDAGSAIARPAVATLAEDLVASGALRRNGASLHLPRHRAGMGVDDAPSWARIDALLRESDARPPLVSEIASRLGEPAQVVRSLLERAARLGLVYRVGESRFVAPGRMARLAAIVEALAAQADDGRVTAAAFRDRCGLGRNLAIDVLECFDRMKFTRRAGDAHLVARPAREVFSGIDSLARPAL